MIEPVHTCVLPTLKGITEKVLLLVVYYPIVLLTGLGIF